jgi:hypothetical protein
VADIREHKRRLKGLDEMPVPRRTLRQRYFRFKSLTRISTLVRWIWFTVVIAVWLVALWGAARLLGVEIEL